MRGVLWLAAEEVVHVLYVFVFFFFEQAEEFAEFGVLGVLCELVVVFVYRFFKLDSGLECDGAEEAKCRGFGCFGFWCFGGGLFALEDVVEEEASEYEKEDGGGEFDVVDGYELLQERTEYDGDEGGEDESEGGSEEDGQEGLVSCRGCHCGELRFVAEFGEEDECKGSEEESPVHMSPFCCWFV